MYMYNCMTISTLLETAHFWLCARCIRYALWLAQRWVWLAATNVVHIIYSNDRRELHVCYNSALFFFLPGSLYSGKDLACVCVVLQCYYSVSLTHDSRNIDFPPQPIPIIHVIMTHKDAATMISILHTPYRVKGVSLSGKKWSHSSVVHILIPGIVISMHTMRSSCSSILVHSGTSSIRYFLSNLYFHILLGEFL